MLIQVKNPAAARPRGAAPPGLAPAPAATAATTPNTQAPTHTLAQTAMSPLDSVSHRMEILRGVQNWPTWSQEELRPLLDATADALPATTLEWDDEAGEGWVRISEGDELTALIRAPTSATRSQRFAFLRSSQPGAHALRLLLRAHRVEVVDILDFEDTTLSAAVDDLETFIGPSTPPAHVFDPQCFSANDLVFVSE